MNINDHSTKVKNLANVLASIGALVHDENLVAVTLTLNGLGKYYIQLCTSIVVRIASTSSNGGSQENVFYSNFNKNRGRSDKNLISKSTHKLAWWTSST
jgi:tRNA splicing ligase